MKSLSIWPTDSYLNVWVVKYIEPNGIAGYSYSPPYLPADADGVVILNENLGFTGTANGNQVNTLSHEIGHYLGLLHPWGCDLIECDSSWYRCHGNSENSINGDFVCDTPPMRLVFGGGCSPLNTCNLDNPDLNDPLDNYMSYSIGSCQNKFTEGQANRMCIFINNYRSGLLNPITTNECSNENDRIISINTIFSHPRKIGGNIIINEGATLSISSYIEFGFNKSIIVRNGGKLIIQNNAKLTKCPNIDYWQGIKLLDGAELTIIKGTIESAYRAVYAQAGSIISVDSLTINGLNSFTGLGIKFDGNVEMVKMKFVRINNVRDGIFINNNPNQFYNFEGGEINNTIYGVTLLNNSGIIDNFHISNSTYGIRIINAPGSIINNCFIGSKEIGIMSFWSPNTLIRYNTIGLPSQISKIGVSMFGCNKSDISNNAQIEATMLGISLVQSECQISFNGINTFGINNQFGGGVQTVNSWSYIAENYLDITQSAFGIETIESIGSPILNNQIDHFSSISNKSAAIISKGSMDEWVSQNVINGIANTTGIIAQNTTSNQYECNLIHNTAEGLGVYSNSEEHEIKGNEFDSNIDLSIRSAIGPQPHHGNKFLGGSVRADSLDQFELANSIFKVNQNIPEFWPDNSDPDVGWFQAEVNLNHFTCSGTYGPTWLPFGGDPNKICSYWQYLKSIRKSKPEQFFIKLLHLIKYSKFKTGFYLPDCIKLDPIFQAICGLTSLVNISFAIDSIGIVNNNTSKLTNLQSQFLLEQNETLKVAIKNQIAAEVFSIIPFINLGRNQDSIKLDSIENVLNSINCSQIIVTKWKEILKLYINFLRQNEVPQNDKTALLVYSSECSDLYGDAIHLARAMANTFINTNFDQYDTCLENSGPRSKEEFDHLYKIEIFPNPTSGKIFLKLFEGYNGLVQVFNSDGTLVISTLVIGNQTNEIDLSNLTGVYYMKFRSTNGEIISKKIIVIR